MPTAQAQINRALKLINVIAENETPTASESNTSFSVLNAMLDLWNVEQLMVYQFQDETHTLTAGVGSYTIGPGGDINTVRPVRIQSAFIRTTDGNDYPIDILNKDDYDKILDKDERGRPHILFYDPAFPLGTIFLYDVPDDASTLHIKTWKPFSSFSTLTTNIDLPPGYDQLLVYNLAVLLAAEFSAPLRPDVLAIAQDTKGKVETLNNRFQNKKSSFDRTFTRGRRRGRLYYR